MREAMQAALRRGEQLYAERLQMVDLLHRFAEHANALVPHVLAVFMVQHMPAVMGTIDVVAVCPNHGGAHRHVVLQVSVPGVQARGEVAFFGYENPRGFNSPTELENLLDTVAESPFWGEVLRTANAVKAGQHPCAMVMQ